MNARLWFLRTKVGQHDRCAVKVLAFGRIIDRAGHPQDRALVRCVYDRSIFRVNALLVEEVGK